MPDIRYVCLSDMHLGEEDSLLTNIIEEQMTPKLDLTKPSPVLEKLVECLRFLLEENKDKIKKPTLILNGDILEMALTTDNNAAMAFERFIELIMPPGKQLFDEIIYIPGNHDHHLWESARETQYVNFISSIAPGKVLDIPYHTTSMFFEKSPRTEKENKPESRPVPLYFLTNLVQRHPGLKDFTIKAAYPNFGVKTNDGNKCVIFSHGHFVEPLYHLISTLKNLFFPKRKLPLQVWDLEAENFAWIDFFWSTMGRSGEAGEDIELIYEKMQNPRQFKKLLDNLADSLAEKYDMPGWGDWMEASILKLLFHYLAKKKDEPERALTEKPLSSEAEKGLQEYLSVYLRNQIDFKRIDPAPSDITFVFGHTHKPFSQDMPFDNFSHVVDVYNPGGWVVETAEPEKMHGGAVVLVDENLNTVSLRMYNEKENYGSYEINVEQTAQASRNPNPFYEKINKMVIANNEPWKSFSSTTAEEVKNRAVNLKRRVVS